MCVVFDETGEKLCPSGRTTFHFKGDIQVKILEKDDKRQYTVGLAVCFDGEKLLGQIIFGGMCYSIR
jgi:hypothetical protein